MAIGRLGLGQLVGGAATGAVRTVVDIGTSRICCFIARSAGAGAHRLIGRGFQLSDGLRAAEVVDADAAEAAIQAVLYEAEQEAGSTVRSIVGIIGAGRPRSVLLKVERPIGQRPVQPEDVRRAVERARAEVARPAVEVLHALPVECTVDGGRPLQDPVGLSGELLHVLVHLVVADAGPVRNLVACLDRCHVEVGELVAAPYAAGLGCLSAEERGQGCLLLDIGAGATQLAHFAHGQLLWVDQVAEGAERVTLELAHALGTSRREAERLKTLYGSVQWRACDDNVRVAVPLLGDRVDQPTGEVPRTRLTAVVRHCMEELFKRVTHRLRDGGGVLRAHPPRSVVLTGGGSQIEGMVELAEELFRLPARLGRPRGIHGARGEEDDPSCSAAAGALALLRDGDGGLRWSDGAEHHTLARGLTRFREWFRQNF
jgi:cell division protein FtsA